MFLYARMFVTMLFGIYTSRIVLEALGETNFGIYNVVGGIVIILNFLNATLVASTQENVQPVIQKMYSAQLLKFTMYYH